MLNDGYEDGAVEKLGAHKPGGPFKGAKYSIYEAGTRVPTIAYWPSRIESNVSDALISQTDFYASFAALTGQALGAGEAVDSKNMLAAITGDTQEGRRFLFYEAVAATALRDGDLKYIPPAPASKKDPKFLRRKGIDSGLSREAQLYDLSSDPGETNNIAPQNEETVAAMQARMDDILKAGYR